MAAPCLLTHWFSADIPADGSIWRRRQHTRSPFCFGQRAYNPVMHIQPSRVLFSKSAMLLASLVLSTTFCATGIAQSSVASGEKPANKLTLGIYHFSESGSASDINVRNSGDYGDIWLGYYQSSKRDEHQGRIGWDSTFDAGAVRITPSAQFASAGYFNWSVGLETGERWFIGAGFGRTNLKPNWNLNFDPNDSWTVSGGWRGEGESFSLLWVRDDRENPDQRHLHAVYRKSLPDGQRITLDVLHKRGLVDGESIRKTGASLTYDWPRFFVRAAYDPKVNFTSEDMWRMSVGTRF